MQIERLLERAKAGSSAAELAEEMFWKERPYVLRDRPDVVTRVFEEVQAKFSLETSEIKVAGSAQLGYSLMHGGAFEWGASDLDIAIVSHGLVDRYAAAARRVTRSFGDVSRFIPTKLPERRTSRTAMDMYLGYERAGIIRVDLMPDCEERSKFLSVLSELALMAEEHFGGITATIYQGRDAFLRAQTRRIDRFLNRRPQYVHAYMSDGAGGSARSEIAFARPERRGCETGARSTSEDDVSPVVGELLDKLEGMVSVECIMTMPLGDPGREDGPVDVVIFYNEPMGEAVRETALKRLASAYLNKNVVITFFPLSRGTASLVKFVAYHASRARDELGSRAVERARYINVTAG